MRAYVVKEFGVPGAIEDREDLSPSAGDVVVTVRAAGVNAMDVGVVAGLMKDFLEHRLPLIPGLDLSGVVRSVGDGAGWKAGDEVFGIADKPFMGEGTFAEQVAVQAASLVAKPLELDHAQAAALPTASLTALSAVNEAGVQNGQTIVVLGATGGVGSFAVQLAAMRGARVVAVTKSDYGAYARELGASDVIDYTQGDVAAAIRAKAATIDAVVDFAGDTALLDSLAPLVRNGGSVISAAAMLDPEAYKAKGLVGKSIRRAPVASLNEIVDLIREKKLRLPAVRLLPLERAADALAEQSQRHVKGKLVLEVAK